jgi:SNF2 family DNA or RNA helicase
MNKLESAPEIRVSSRGQTTIALTAGNNSRRLCAIRDTLAGLGLAVSTNWSKRELYAPVNTLQIVCDALKSERLSVDPDLQEHITASRNGESNIRLAKLAVAEFASAATASDALNDFPEVRLLDAHQIQAVAAATHPVVKGLCLFDEQGLGKTISALFSFHRLRQREMTRKMLVLCPKNMVFEWQRDALKFFGGRYRCCAVTGSQEEKRRTLAASADIYVTNFETAIRLQFRLRTLLEAEAGRVLLVVDESFYVKNTCALRSRAVRSLRNYVDRCLVLCGTPAPNRPHDLVEQFNIADNGVAFSGISLPDDRHAALPIVQTVLNEKAVYMRRLKQDVFPHLPGKTFQQVLVPLAPQQEALYSDSLNDYIVRLESCDDAAFRKNRTSFMAHRVRLLQICSNPIGIDVRYGELPAKLQALDSILEELIERRKEKVIIWCYFTASLEAIINRYADYRPLRIDGKVSDINARGEAVRRFQEDSATKLFVANIAAASAGLTLHKARYAIYESLSNQAAHYFQSLDRIHRRGQTRPVEYIVLLCDRTLEAQEYSSLLEKEKVSQFLLGDQAAPQITRQTLLAEAKEAKRILESGTANMLRNE